MSCLFCIFAAHIKIQMETLYYNSLLVAWPLLFVFSFILLFGKVPDRDIYRSYNRTRRIVGVALGLFAIQILLQWLFNFRENTPLHAAGLNLTCYYLEAILLGMAYISLLDESYISRRRIIRDFAKYALAMVCIWVSIALDFAAGVMAGAAIFLFESLRITIVFFRTYRHSLRMMDDFYSEDTEGFIVWLYHSTLLIVFFGLIGSFMAFMPLWAVGMYMFAGIFVFIYIFMSLLNYMFNYEKVEEAVALVPEAAEANAASRLVNDKVVNMDEKVKSWVGDKKFLQQGITINTLAEAFHTNRTDISAYFNKHHKVSFREWINRLRIQEAKSMMENNRDLSFEELALATGFASRPYFCTIFKQQTGMTPAEWKKQMLCDAAREQ